MAFILGIVYGWGQTVFTYVMRPRMSSLFVSHLRLALSILATGFFIACKCTFVPDGNIRHLSNVWHYVMIQIVCEYCWIDRVAPIAMSAVFCCTYSLTLTAH